MPVVQLAQDNSLAKPAGIFDLDINLDAVIRPLLTTLFAAGGTFAVVRGGRPGIFIGSGLLGAAGLVWFRPFGFTSDPGGGNGNGTVSELAVTEEATYSLSIEAPPVGALRGDGMPIVAEQVFITESSDDDDEASIQLATKRALSVAAKTPMPVLPALSAGSLSGSRTGPRLELAVEALDVMVLITTWTIQNTGSVDASVGLFSSLQADRALGDISHLQVDENLIVTGNLALSTAIGFGSHGVSLVPAGGSFTMFREILIPSTALEAIQGFGFNWWVIHTIAKDMSTGEEIESSTFNPSELRDWFKLTVPSSSLLRVNNEALYQLAIETAQT